MSRLLFCVLICAFAGSYALVGKTCKTQDECDEGECCQVLSQFMVVSKRELNKISLLNPDRTGTCRLYKTEGQTCSGFEKINGYCSCGPNLTCYSREEPIDSADSASSRIMVQPKPGYKWVATCEEA